MIQSILVANRGEIACRIIRTARRLGLRTVAVYSEADAQAMHVAQADQAVAIGPAAARESYLVGEKIIAAALETGAQAIHPGYGFLSENAAFAQAVLDAGLVWVGPPPAAISAMGLKDAAKALMQQAGVPTTPGYLGENQDAEFLAAEAAKVGYPVLIKAVAGGGGKGMRLVEQPQDFADALASCQREAAASFGNAHVLIEKYILSPRHIEVQVFGDAHGNVVHLFERDCSLQRRHQKVIEEAPAPGMDEATRAAVCQAAVRAAQAVGYQGAGTIEFIADGSEGLRADRIWFMEMNTRLQVEHPVTEATTGVDLVEWQIRVASGEPLPRRQDELTIQGWAMEARLYAEDPAKGFLPSIGRLDHLQFGMVEGGRIDTGVAQGDTISPFYDPMVAKVIAHGPSREDARQRLAKMLDETAIWPVRTNAAFLARLLHHPQFVAGDVDTGLIGRDGAALAEPLAPSAAALAKAAARLVVPSLAPGLRLNAAPVRTGHFLLDGAPIEIAFAGAATNPAPFTLVCEHGQVWRLEPWHHKPTDGATAGDGAILAPMPGRVIAVSVAQGETVTKGQKLLTLEAMKMEHTLVAPFDGVVDALETQAGAQVQVDALLARITQQDD
ncbi:MULTISPECIES: acetyl/propionyl/methylcrotonyl-CoA carboxylase subunit alpha [unclassified Novosphingobium]|uniref:acetyl/propionyl/methylcrotonyl-CoA carboxylase subunit alpha n=1 Tax=unclassified Novosphingobium TaxID=2644732 RepID=UPI000D3063F0|nr:MULTISPECIES: acetyl/propionyl/methylcrotonyl-CoA carboxylase subunit alpha [unclassified Novosphingobium]PTR13211.1 3-methylcrotonyl-CoA carboxylase alpha subunit [Novosphingobium sp. GV055]PUB07430.1 3-methylcrotonyl-CoA carboxylase alpha subunit [Novosphingobium sp. GV061]PUB23243.1 3-methylcrotonyl-CoA carboxylase alpha subunit [Novosphingobium sp. GV079]PUB45007.1 3-methylcrotonyl-CoA carboxylase alpha subunit [Novosphingobium sp. GV027]